MRDLETGSHERPSLAWLSRIPLPRTPDDHLQRVHARLGITREAFLVMADLLKEAMEDHDMETADVDSVLHEIRVREHLVVTRP